MKALVLALSLAAFPAYAYDVKCNDSKGQEKCTTLGEDDCAIPIIKAIDSATETLDVQYYNFTEPRIGDAVVNAFKRGVKVRAVFDKKSAGQINEQVEKLYDAGIPVWIDHLPPIAHDKTSVIDGHITTGGSFNPSHNADAKNAENVTVDDSVCIADVSTRFITDRIAVSVPFTGGGK